MGRVESGVGVGWDLFFRCRVDSPYLDDVIRYWSERILFDRFHHPWNSSIGQLIWSSRYGHEKVQFSIDCVSCPSGLWRGFRNVGVFQLSLLSMRLTDCAHEFGSSLCDAFLAHFEGVQFVLEKLAGEAGFRRAVGCFPGGFSCRGGRGGVETW